MTLSFDLLDSLDARLKATQGKPQLAGLFCIGVRRGLEERWWQVLLGNDVQTTFLDQPAPDADALLLLGGEEADAILLQGKLPASPKLIRYEGDRALLQTFIERYLTGPSQPPPTDPKKAASDSRALSEVAADLQKKLAQAYQENDPAKLAEWERKDEEREAAIAKEIVRMRNEGMLPGGKKAPPKKS